MEKIIKFVPFASAIDLGFWFELSKRKLDIFKLDEKPIKASGYFPISKNSEQPPIFIIDSESFEIDSKYKVIFLFKN